MRNVKKVDVKKADIRGASRSASEELGHRPLGAYTRLKLALGVLGLGYFSIEREHDDRT
jgi:hypothetical protein